MIVINADNNGKAVNLRLVNSIETQDLSNTFDICFRFNERIIGWSFNTEDYRDLAYEKIIELINAQEV